MKSVLTAFFIAWLTLTQMAVSTSAIMPAWADPLPTPSASITASPDEFDGICSAILSGDIPANSTAYSEQKKQYCQAAIGGRESVKDNELLWKVWATVTGVCVAACATSIIAGIGNQFICAGASAGAGITDGVVTRNFMNALMGLGGLGAGLVTNMMVNSNRSDPAPGTPATKNRTKDIGACIQAAAAGLQVFMKFQAKKSGETTVITNLMAAKALESNATSGNTTPTALSTMNTPMSATGAVASGQNVNSASAILPSNTNSFGSSCNGVTMTSSPGAIMSCAISKDSKLPPLVTQPRFGSDFKKASGMELKDFLANDMSPERAVVTASSNALSPADSSRLTSAYLEMKDKLNIETPGSTYAQGGRRGPSSDGSDAELSNLVSGMMGQFLPKSDETTSANTQGANEVYFGKLNRGLANETDMSISLFDRVTYRYHFVTPRVAGGVN